MGYCLLTFHPDLQYDLLPLLSCSTLLSAFFLQSPSHSQKLYLFVYFIPCLLSVPCARL